MAVNPPLIGLLGAQWDLGARIVGAAWSGDGAVAAFGIADGTVALARAEWQGGPQLRQRAGGGVEVSPPTEPNPPLSRVRVHENACRALVADPAGGFLSGGADGRLVRLGADGAAETLDAFPGRAVDCVAAGRAGRRAAASGCDVLVIRESRQSFQTSAAVAALAFDPDGHHLAIAHQAGMAWWSDAGGAPRRLSCPSPALALAWSPGGAWLAIGSAGGLHGWRVADDTMHDLGPAPGDLRSLSFAGDGRLLAASGGARATCWRFDAAGPIDAEPIEGGVRNRISPVCAIACHPKRSLVAVGHENGAVLLCQPGSDDALFAKHWGGGAVTALAWSRDGQRLALATADGLAGLLLLPPGLLRGDGARAEVELAR